MALPDRPTSDELIKRYDKALKRVHQILTSGTMVAAHIVVGKPEEGEKMLRETVEEAHPELKTEGKH